MNVIKEKFREFTYRPFAFSSSLRRQLAHQERRLDVLESFIGLAEHKQNNIVNEICTMWEFLVPKKLVNSTKVRVGSDSDGGYILASDYSNAGVVVSLGVGTENEVDVKLANLGITVHEFDHTVKREPKRHENLFFHPQGIGQGLNLLSFDQIIEIANVKETSILLCDIEGAEFDINAGFSEANLSKFQQIVFELHNLERIVTDFSNNNILDTLRMFSKHHQVIHCHANNFAPMFEFGGISLPSVLEISLVRRNDYEFGDFDLESPQILDRPNDSRAQDKKIKFPKF